jgi:hypothetical protein
MLMAEAYRTGRNLLERFPNIKSGLHLVSCKGGQNISYLVEALDTLAQSIPNRQVKSSWRYLLRYLQTLQAHRHRHGIAFARSFLEVCM